MTSELLAWSLVLAGVILGFVAVRRNIFRWKEIEIDLERIKGDLRSRTEELAREREELATLMRSLTDAIIAVDLHGHPQFFNARFALLFDCESWGEAWAGRTVKLSRIFKDQEILAAFEKALTWGEGSEVGLPITLPGEGKTRYFQLSVSPLSRENRDVFGAVGIFHDVSELKRAEQIRIDFVANVSHELRTPLTAIKGYADTMLGDVREGRWDSAEKFLGVIQRNSERLMSLISDLLDLSALESGTLDEEVRTELNTRELTSRVLSELESLRATKNHVIEVTDTVGVVYGEARRVEQVLVNLLANAIKYVPPGGGRIKISWERWEKGTRLRVSDNGPGISPEHQARLFERFYRVDKGRSREQGGTGLGLAIVKHIMQAHGGSAYVMSEIGKGAEFICSFPS